MSVSGFHRDEAYAKAVGSFYGDYITSFESEHGQVSARLFKSPDGAVTAYVAFMEGFDRGRATDAYASRLKKWGQDEGFPSVRLVMSGSRG